MDEARFVLKCFVFAALLVVVTQLKTKTGTIESDIQATLVSSQTAELVNKIADGGVKAVKDLGIYLRAKISSTIQSAPSKETVQQTAEVISVDTKKAIQKIEDSVKSAAQKTKTAAKNEIEEIEEIE